MQSWCELHKNVCLNGFCAPGTAHACLMPLVLICWATPQILWEEQKA